MHIIFYKKNRSRDSFGVSSDLLVKGYIKSDFRKANLGFQRGFLAFIHNTHGHYPAQISVFNWARLELEYEAQLLNRDFHLN